MTTFSQDLKDWNPCLERDGCSVGVEMGALLGLTIEKVHLLDWSWLEREDLIRSHYYLKGVSGFALTLTQIMTQIIIIFILRRPPRSPSVRTC